MIKHCVIQTPEQLKQLYESKPEGNRAMENLMRVWRAYSSRECAASATSRRESCGFQRRAAETREAGLRCVECALASANYKNPMPSGWAEVVFETKQRKVYVYRTTRVGVRVMIGELSYNRALQLCNQMGLEIKELGIQA